MGDVPVHWQANYPLSELTTWRIGGPAAYLSSSPDADTLRSDLAAARDLGLPTFAIGGGSNLLVADEGYRGLVIRLPSAFPVRSASEDGLTVSVAAGASLTDVARQLARQGLAGLEWAEGIPGTVGGAIVNNAGAHGGTIDRVLTAVNVVSSDATIEEWPRERLEFAYRRSVLKGREPTDVFLLRATFRMEHGAPDALQEVMRSIRERRLTRQPVGPSCGCVFKNPPGAVAGQLIQEAGLTGLARGGAKVSSLHANFILNEAGAKARDVIELIARVRQAVRARTGHHLELEVQFVGFPASVTEELVP